jgi:tetraacyldisaccharide 4'-kinase
VSPSKIACRAPIGAKERNLLVFRPSEFRELVSGRRRGLAASLLRFGLWLAEIPYTLVVGWRNRRYDRGIVPTHRIPAPVVSVGNLTLGGTGKTPMVQWIAQWLRQHDIRVTVVSRGYGAETGSQNDEARELEERLPDVPHVQNPDRVSGALMAVEEFDCQMIVLDDAFQHRRIARDFDLVLLDASEPFGFDHVFPRGTLREPAVNLRRADFVVLSRSDLLNADQRSAIRERVSQLAPNAGWAEVVHAPQSLRNASGEIQSLDSLVGVPVAAFCGIGNPAGFRHTLQSCGYQVIAVREFADHYRYTRTDVDALMAWAESLPVKAILCTYKDLVKLGVDRLGNRPLWAVTIGLEFLVGRVELEDQLTLRLPRELTPQE